MKTESRNQIANHREFDSASLELKCEEKNGSVYWYIYDESKLKTVSVPTTRGCGRLSKTTGNPWARTNKKAATEILAKYGITTEQFIAYWNEDPELMREFEAQRAEERRAEELNFFMSMPLTSDDALQVATEAEIQLAKLAEEKAETADNAVADNVVTINVETTDNTAEEKAETTSTAATVNATNEVKLISSPEPDMTEYKVKIGMFGDKTPMFSMDVNGKPLNSKSRNWRKKEVDAWVLQAYEERYKYPNMTIEVQEEVAVLFLDSFACNPRIVREMNVLMTGMTDAERNRIAEYEKSFDEKGIRPLPSRSYTVASSAEAFALVAKYFPDGEWWYRFTSCSYDGKEVINYYNETYEATVQAFIAQGNSWLDCLLITLPKDRVWTKITIDRAKSQVAEPVIPQITEPESPQASVVPCGDYTVSSGAEAFALVAPYFPDGIKYDGIDYGYRGEKIYCYYDESTKMHVIACSSDNNQRIEELLIMSESRKYLMTVTISKTKAKAAVPVAEPASPKVAVLRAEPASPKVAEPVAEPTSPKVAVLRAEPASPKVAEKSQSIVLNTKKVVLNTNISVQIAQSTSDKKKVTSKKKAQPKNNSQAERWLEGAKVDDEGRYYVVPELSYKNFAENTNWNPCFYVVTSSLKLRRVGLKFAIELAKDGRAIEISKDGVATLAK